MAGNRDPPPPPMRAEEIVHVGGPPLDDLQPLRSMQQQRPQMQQQRPQMQQQRQPVMMQQRQQQQQQPQRMAMGPQFARNVQVVNNFGSEQISDIRPPLQLTEGFARHKLTVYEVFTLRKADPLPDYHEFKELKQTSKGSKKITKPKANWLRVIRTRDSFDMEDIIAKIKSLDRRGHSVTTKKKDLAPNQHSQVTKLLDEKNAWNNDPAFSWTLVQLDSKIVTNHKTGLKETESMTLYLKRAPLPSVDAVALYQTIEMNNMLARQAQQQPKANQGMGQMGGQMGGMMQKVNHIGPPKGAQGANNKTFGLGGPGTGRKLHDPIINVTDERRYSKSPKFAPVRGGNKKKYHGESDSSDESLSDSDSDRTFSSDSETTLSSRSGRRRRDSGYARRDREPSRHHEKEYHAARRRPSIIFAPEAPRVGRATSYERTSIAGVNPEVADAIFTAGVRAATSVHMADRERERRALSPVASPRAIVFPGRGSPRGSFDDIGLRDLRELRIRDDLSMRDDLSSRGLAEHRDELLMDDLRREDFLRREEIKMREAEDRMRRDSMGISPRTRFVPVGSLRGSVSQLPLDAERAFNYSRNPFMPDTARRRESMRERDRMGYRGYV